jgi:hypothetical protein
MCSVIEVSPYGRVPGPDAGSLSGHMSATLPCARLLRYRPTGECRVQMQVRYPGTCPLHSHVLGYRGIALRASAGSRCRFVIRAHVRYTPMCSVIEVSPYGRVQGPDAGSLSGHMSLRSMCSVTEVSPYGRVPGPNAGSLSGHMSLRSMCSVIEVSPYGRVHPPFMFLSELKSLSTFSPQIPHQITAQPIMLKHQP